MQSCLGGNQRDLARQKAAKKASESSKGQRTDGLTVAQRKQRDADAMRAKQEVGGMPIDST